jgi:hypothetical protein
MWPRLEVQGSRWIWGLEDGPVENEQEQDVLGPGQPLPYLQYTQANDALKVSFNPASSSLHLPPKEHRRLPGSNTPTIPTTNTVIQPSHGACLV